MKKKKIFGWDYDRLNAMAKAAGEPEALLDIMKVYLRGWFWV